MKHGVRNAVKEFRKEKSLTQDQLAESISVTRQTIIAIDKQRYEPCIVSNKFYFTDGNSTIFV